MKKILLLMAIFIVATHVACSKEKADMNSATAEPYFFIQLSDLQLGFIEDNKSFEPETRLMEQAIEIINRLNPDFVVITGDMVNASTGERQIAEIKRLLKKINSSIPVHMIPGNHDISDKNVATSQQAYVRNYGYDRFAFQHKGSMFVGINSCVVKNDTQPLEAEQFKWLGRQLDKGKDSQFCFVFSHHSVFLKSADEKDGYSNFQEPIRSKYLTLFKDKGVDAIFAGHLHDNSYGKYEGMDMVTCGALGKALGSGFHGMNLVRVYSDKYDYKYIALDEFPAKVEF